MPPSLPCYPVHFPESQSLREVGSMVAAAVGSGPRYAPVDPSLPPPWRALVDGNTGYIYYWNTDTNVTQYEKPLPAQAPPLPSGPPPVPASSGVPKSAVTSIGPSDGQSGRSAEARGSANGNMPASTAVSTQGSGGNVHGLSGGNLHAGGGGNSFPNSSIHDTSGNNVAANMYGNTNSDVAGHAGGHVSGGIPRSGPGMSGSGPRSGPGMVGSGPRSGSGMPGGTVHMNAGDNSYGNSGRHTHGSSAGPMKGGNMHASSARTSYGGPSGNAPAQPKLAALPMPQRQQAVGGMHMPPIQPRHMGHTNSSGPGPAGPSGAAHATLYKRTASDYTINDSVSSGAPGSGQMAPYKRAASDYTNSDPDLHKKPRMQGFSDSPLPLDVDAYRRQHEITVVGDNMPPPFMTFGAANFPAEISRELHTAGFSAPTPIQAQTWPIALQGRNIVAIAKTGSGKTLGYLVPAFLHLARTRVNSQFGPAVLVLAPTRELATQIQDEAVKFGRSSRISCTCVYGGAPKGQQLRDLDRGADIVIATPGRLNDFLEMKKVSLRQVSYLVLDEADRMLDMGFEPQIRKIVQELPPRRQTLMYTATWPKEVRKIAADLLVNPVQVNIGNSDELTANKSITQHVEMVHPYEKQRRLEQILRSQEPGSKIIIFCSTKKMCDQLSKHLCRGFGAAAIHGDKSQSERDYVLAQFKSGRSPILVATDVAARGLDIKDIRVVINFDFPTGVEDYVHRIGRTGRAGATGVSFTFFADQDAKHAKELIRVLEGANQKVPVELRDLAGKSFHLKGRGGRWEAGGMGGRDGGYNSFGGGRGDGRSDFFGGRGSWGPPAGQQFDRRERNFDRFGDREKFADKSARDDRYRGRDVGRKLGARERGRSYSRSPSRSRGKSRSRSRSRSRSHEKYSDDHYKRSPYRGRGSYRSRSPYRSVSPRSPYQSRSPYGHVNAAKEGPPLDQSTVLDVEGEFSIALKEHHPPDQVASPQGRGAYRSKSPFRSVSPRSPYQSRSPYKHGKPAISSKEPQPSDQSTLPDAEGGFSVAVKERQLPEETMASSVNSSIIVVANDLHEPEQLRVSATPSEMEELNHRVHDEKIVDCVNDDAGAENIPEVDDKIMPN